MIGLGDLTDALDEVRLLSTRMADLTQALGDFQIPGTLAVEIAKVPTHRQWQPTKTARIEQTAAGFLAFATPEQGLHYIKILGAFLTVDAAGTIQFFMGAGKDAGTTGVDVSITGTLDIATNGGFVLPMTSVEDPWLFGEPGMTLSFNTATSKVSGWIVYCNSPDNA